MTGDYVKKSFVVEDKRKKTSKQYEEPNPYSVLDVLTAEEGIRGVHYLVPLDRNSDSRFIITQLINGLPVIKWATTVPVNA